MDLLDDNSEVVPNQINDAAFREFLNTDKEAVKLNNLDKNEFLSSKRSEEKCVNLSQMKNEPSRRASLKTVSKVIADANFSKQNECGYINSIDRINENKPIHKQMKEKIKPVRDISFEKVDEDKNTPNQKNRVGYNTHDKIGNKNTILRESHSKKMSRNQNVTDKKSENPNFGSPSHQKDKTNYSNNDRDSPRTFSLPPDKLHQNKPVRTEIMTEKTPIHNDNYLRQLENTQNFTKKKLALDFNAVYEQSDKNLPFTNNDKQSFSERHKNVRSTLNSKQSNKNEGVINSLNNVNQAKPDGEQKQLNSLASTTKLFDNQSKGIKDINTKGDVRIRLKKEPKKNKANNPQIKNQSDIFMNQEINPINNNLPQTLKNLGLDPMKLKGVDRHIALVAMNSRDDNYDIGMSKNKSELKKRLRNSSIYDTQQTPFGNNKAEEITENIDPDTTPVIYSDAQNNIQTPIDLRNPKAYRNQTSQSVSISGNYPAGYGQANNVNYVIPNPKDQEQFVIIQNPQTSNNRILPGHFQMGLMNGQQLVKHNNIIPVSNVNLSQNMMYPSINKDNPNFNKKVHESNVDYLLKKYEYKLSKNELKFDELPLVNNTNPAFANNYSQSPQSVVDLNKQVSVPGNQQQIFNATGGNLPSNFSFANIIPNLQVVKDANGVEFYEIIQQPFPYGSPQYNSNNQTSASPNVNSPNVNTPNMSSANKGYQSQQPGNFNYTHSTNTHHHNHVNVNLNMNLNINNNGVHIHNQNLPNQNNNNHPNEKDPQNPQNYHRYPQNSNIDPNSGINPNSKSHQARIDRNIGKIRNHNKQLFNDQQLLELYCNPDVNFRKKRNGHIRAQAANNAKNNTVQKKGGYNQSTHHHTTVSYDNSGNHINKNQQLYGDPSHTINIQQRSQFNDYQKFPIKLNPNDISEVNSIKPTQNNAISTILQRAETGHDNMSLAQSKNANNVVANINSTSIYGTSNYVQNNFNKIKKKTIQTVVRNVKNVPPHPLLSFIIKNSSKMFTQVFQKELDFVTKGYFLKDFQFKLNYSNHMLISPPKNNIATYKYYAVRGNNGTLIKNCMRTRYWWVCSDGLESMDNHFVWTQGKKQEFLDRCKYKGVNDNFDRSEQTKTRHMYIDTAKTTKSTVLESGDGNSSNAESDSNLSMNLATTPVGKNKLVVKKASSQNNKVREMKIKRAQNKNNENFELYRKFHEKILTDREIDEIYDYQMNNLKPTTDIYVEDLKNGELSNANDIQYIDNPTSNLVHNHIDCNWHLGHKKALFMNLKFYYESLKEDAFAILPITFHLKGLDDPEYVKFKECYYTIQTENQMAKEKQHLTYPKNLWILKPGENTNKGRDIIVVENEDQIKAEIRSQQIVANRTFILQKYIERPQLYQKRKFDIRCFMLVTSMNRKMKAYWYTEGYVRTTSKEYTLKDRSLDIHLTNDAVQKKFDVYGKFENANKVSFADFEKYIDNLPENENEPGIFRKRVYPLMKSISTDAVRGTFMKLDPNRVEFGFELYGQDYQIDENYKVWIIEFNTNPALTVNCPVLSRILPQMIENVIRVAVDPIFPPPNSSKINTKHKTIPQEVLENNKFELIFDEERDRPALSTLMQNADQLIIEIDEEYENEDDDKEDEQ